MGSKFNALVLNGTRTHSSTYFWSVVLSIQARVPKLNAQPEKDRLFIAAVMSCTFLALLKLWGIDFFVEEPLMEVSHAGIVVSSLSSSSSSSSCHRLPHCHLPDCHLPCHLPPVTLLLHCVCPSFCASDLLRGPCQLAMLLQ